MYDEFEARNTVVVAVAQEDETLEQHARMLTSFEGGPRFPVVADIGHRGTRPYDRTSAYLIDTRGKVRQVFPMLIHSRPTWRAILDELDRVLE